MPHYQYNKLLHRINMLQCYYRINVEQLAKTDAEFGHAVPEQREHNIIAKKCITTRNGDLHVHCTCIYIMRIA